MATEADYLAIALTEESAVYFENGALSAHKATLPHCAQEVLDGRGASPLYWAWLIESFVAHAIAVKGAASQAPACNAANPYVDVR